MSRERLDTFFFFFLYRLTKFKTITVTFNSRPVRHSNDVLIIIFDSGRTSSYHRRRLFDPTRLAYRSRAARAPCVTHSERALINRVKVLSTFSRDAIKMFLNGQSCRPRISDDACFKGATSRPIVRVLR